MPKFKKPQFITLNYNVPILESGMLDKDFVIQGIAINATITGNNHKFLAEELRISASTLNGVPLLVDHKNEIDAIKGRVILGEFDEANQRINFKANVMNEGIRQMIKSKLINSVSVGAAVREIEEEGDVLIPRGIVFKELSLVAVPADAGATFTTALQEAYKLTKEEDKDEDEDEEDKEEDITDILEAMQKCKECGKMVDEKKMKEHMAKHKEADSQSPNKETLDLQLKGGIKMSEEKLVETKEVVETKVEIKDNSKELMAELQKLRADLNDLKEKAKEVKVEVKAVEEEEESDVKNIGKYNIVQGYGSIRGNSYSLVR